MFGAAKVSSSNPLTCQQHFIRSFWMLKDEILRQCNLFAQPLPWSSFYSSTRPLWSLSSRLAELRVTPELTVSRRFPLVHRTFPTRLPKKENGCAGWSSPACWANYRDWSSKSRRWRAHQLVQLACICPTHHANKHTFTPPLQYTQHMGNPIFSAHIVSPLLF